MSRVARTRIPILLLTGLFAAAAAPACGPDWPVPVFAFETRPGPTADEFLNGRLGVLPGRLAPAYRLILYRHLAIDAPAEATATVFGGFFSPAPTGVPWSDSPAERWRREAARLGADPGWIDGVRREERQRPTGTFYVSYPNCLDDAFETAIETLAARVEIWGEGSPELSTWLEGQSAVFANCRGGESTPGEPRSEWLPLLRQDRRYQIAAAHLYSGRWEAARERFAAIGADESSPWAPISRYLVGRCDLRLERWQDAIASFERVLAEPALERWHPSARGLTRLARLRLDPATRGAEIVANLLAPVPTGDPAQDFLDLLRQPWIVDRGTDFGRWFSVANPEQALALWRDQPSEASLALALATVEPGGESSIDDLEAAAERVPEDAPLALTAVAFRARSALFRGELGRVRSLLDPWLARDDLSPSDRNRLAALRAPAAGELIEYVTLSLARPVADRPGGGSREVPLRVGASALALPPRPHRILERQVSLAGWLRLVDAETLDPEIRATIALSGFTRATALDEPELARTFAGKLQRLDPATGSPLLDATRSDQPDERRFASALALLETPGATIDLAFSRPYLDFSQAAESPARTLSNLRLNWWCAPVGGADSENVPAFLHGADRMAAVERERLDATEAGPILLGRRILEHADRHRDDPRVPRALHRVVRATRYPPNCPDTRWGEVSREAFERLHERYPESEWTARTPYWFDG